MTTRRLLKAAEAIRSVVGMSILTEVRDPRVQGVTVTGVEVAPDMRSAKVHVSILGDEAAEKLALRGLQNSAGFLQQRISERIDTRYIPKLQFVIDKGVKKSLEVARILHEVLPSDDRATPLANSTNIDSTTPFANQDDSQPDAADDSADQE